MAGNHNHIQYNSEVDTVPRSTAAPGTVETVNGLGTKVVGVGTNFNKTFQIGDWIFIPSEKECRRIASIESDTELTISQAFTNNILAAGQVYRKTKRLNASMLTYAFDNAGGSIDGVMAFPTQSLTLEQGSKGGQRGERLDPLVVEALGVVQIVIHQA